MLRINISIVLSFIGICLNFMNSSADDDNMDLIEKYKKGVNFNGSYAEYSSVLKYNHVCNMPREHRVALCKFIIRQLRSQDKLNIYMNYLAFIEQEPCTDVRVWINEGDVLAHQTALNCFGRSAISAFESQEEMVYFYRRIVIYPEYTSYMWVFEYNEEKDYYTILTRSELKLVKTLHSSAKFNKLFSIPTPQGWRKVSNLFTILYPIHQQLIHYRYRRSKSCKNEMYQSYFMELNLSQKSNPTIHQTNIVHSSEYYNHYKLCYLVFRSENYKKKLNYNSKNTPKPEPKKLQATLRGPEVNFPVSIITYTCNNSVQTDTTFMSKYRIAAGPGDYSVILLKDVNSDDNDNPHYVITELVEYVTEDYISFYFNHFY